MAFKLIAQDIVTLRQAYREREREYTILRSGKAWSGAVLYGGILLEIALKIAICKNLKVTHLPRVFQVHDLDFLLYCSGLRDTFQNTPELKRNFDVVLTRWSMELRYEGSVVTEKKSEEIHNALFDSSNGVLTYLTSLGGK